MPNPNANFDIPKPNLATSWTDAAAQIRRPNGPLTGEMAGHGQVGPKPQGDQNG